ncbi:MAG: L-iditol 2-dehydrogenase [Shimia sp.]
MSGRLDGKGALITGGARGIGRALAEAYMAEGAHVAIADVDPTVDDVAREIGATAIRMDVADQASIDAGVAAADAALGGVDVLVNNAALFCADPIVHIARADYDRVFAVNVAGPLFTMQAVARGMIARGRGGKIVNMASQAGRRGEALVAVYCASKAAVISLTQSAALNLIPHGINVNAIAPGVVDGAHWDGVDAEFARLEGLAPGDKKRAVGAAVPLGRMAVPADLTGMAVFLASSESDYVVGQTYNVDGGQVLN